MAETYEQRQSGISQVNKNQAAAAKLGIKLPGSSGVNDAPAEADPLLVEIRKKLQSKADLISSSSSGIEQAISGAMGASEKSRAASESRINTDYQSDRDFMLRGAERSVTDFSESRNGFGTQLAALRNLVETTDKSLRDLDQRRQDALMANDSASANRIADLQIKAVEFREQKMQQGYDNLFKLSEFDLAANAQKTSAEQFKFTLDLKRDEMAFNREQLESREQETMAGLAVEFGEELQVGETLQSLTKRIAPKADAKRRKELELLNAQISNAYKKSDEEEEELVYDDILVDAYGDNPDPEVMAQVVLSTMRGSGQGIKPSEYNKIKIRAKEISEKMKKDADRIEAERTPSVWEKMFSSKGGNNFTEGLMYGNPDDIIFGSGKSKQPKTLEEFNAQNLGYYQAK